ncbi:40-residue YVTN family beta-propeller repeat-containing protein [Poseidonocella pacifica]|uniref:40-residue YVTN family beta-propeller repeat-containing protein n=2 Tax=Poseidonocella pacifica TaxID=871651 RepID=A0A1I0YHW6_9RHOB|nr:YncE family protein [Poseidonocella pacifica]SFB12467.1 40-residue YVTN family beta-propeller repeat-containing protein [Poseidonocella pacifica]
MAYITNQSSSDLSVLDLETRSELRRISVPGQPAGVVAHGTEAFTVSPESKTVRRIDTRSGEVLAEVLLDGGPIGIALDLKGGRVFVSDWYNARIWVLDALSLTVIDTLQTGSAPAGLAIQSGLLAAANRDADQVSIFDLSDLSSRGVVPTGERPFGLGFAPDGRLFVGNVGTNDVTVIDPEAGEVIGTVPVGERPYGVAFAKGQAFVTNQYSDSVSVINLQNLEVIRQIDVGEYPEGIDVTGDGERIVVANWFSNSVTLIDAGTLEVLGEIETGDGPRAFGRFIAREDKP